jgi:hypothetical protein
VFIGGGVIAAAALVVLFQNYPPQPKDAAGTIGAAQRYHETQITGSDVAVSQDALTTWIQSDTFDRIVKDPQARRLFADAAVSAMFTDAGRTLALKEAGGTSADAGRTLALKEAGGTSADAGHTLALKEAGGTSADADAVRLKRFVAMDDGSRVQVSLNPDSARRLSEVAGVDSALKFKLNQAVAGGDASRKVYLEVSPDLALKFKLFEAKDQARNLKLSADEARSLGTALDQESMRRLNLSEVKTDGVRREQVSVGPDEARRLAEVLGTDAALKFKLLEKDQARKVTLDLDANTARRLTEALAATDSARKVALGPDAARKVALAMDVAQARAQGLKVNDGAVRVMNAALDNAAISAALNNADFVRAFASNPSLAEGLVAKTRSEYIDQSN